RGAISRVALGKSFGICEPVWIEERMRLVDTGVDIPDLNPGPGSCPAACCGPRSIRANDEVALAQSRVVKHIVLGALHHWCGCDCRQRRSVELHRHCVK